MQLAILHLLLLYIVNSTSDYIGPVIVLKDVTSTVEYTGIPLKPETSLFLEFYGHPLQGRLFYAENATMGTFISLKINRPGTLRFEMKLTATNRSHQFIILSAPLEHSRDQFHSIDLRISLARKVAVLFVNGRNAYPVRLVDTMADSVKYSFGDYLYMGRLPQKLLEDASKVVHFTAAMEFSFVGILKSIFVNRKGLIPLNVSSGAEIAAGLSHCYHLNRQVAGGGGIYFTCPRLSNCLDGHDGPRCGCTTSGERLGICRIRESTAISGRYALYFCIFKLKFFISLLKMQAPTLDSNVIMR